jgi:hypothetical protein
LDATTDWISKTSSENCAVADKRGVISVKSVLATSETAVTISASSSVYYLRKLAKKDMALLVQAFGREPERRSLAVDGEPAAQPAQAENEDKWYLGKHLKAGLEKNAPGDDPTAWYPGKKLVEKIEKHKTRVDQIKKGINQPAPHTNTVSMAIAFIVCGMAYWLHSFYYTNACLVNFLLQCCVVS